MQQWSWATSKRTKVGHACREDLITHESYNLTVWLENLLILTHTDPIRVLKLLHLGLKSGAREISVRDSFCRASRNQPLPRAETLPEKFNTMILNLLSAERNYLQTLSKTRVPGAPWYLSRLSI